MHLPPHILLQWILHTCYDTLYWEDYHRCLQTLHPAADVLLYNMPCRWLSPTEIQWDTGDPKATWYLKYQHVKLMILGWNMQKWLVLHVYRASYTLRFRLVRYHEDTEYPSIGKRNFVSIKMLNILCEELKVTCQGNVFLLRLTIWNLSMIKLTKTNHWLEVISLGCLLIL